MKTEKYCDTNVGDCSIRIQTAAVVASKKLQKLKQLCVTAQLYSKSITGFLVNIGSVKGIIGIIKKILNVPVGG